MFGVVRSRDGLKTSWGVEVVGLVPREGSLLGEEQRRKRKIVYHGTREGYLLEEEYWRKRKIAHRRTREDFSFGEEQEWKTLDHGTCEAFSLGQYQVGKRMALDHGTREGVLL